MVSTLYLSPRNIQDLGKSIAKAIGPNKGGMTSGSTDTSKTGGVDTAAILNSIKAKYEVKVEKQQAKTDKLADKRSAISDLKSISSNLSSAISNLKATGGSSIFNSLAATGTPAGVTITPSAGAKVGAHTMSVSSVASKQTIIIQTKDSSGNPKGFDPGDVTGGDGFFTRDSTFRICADSNNDTTLATITIDNAATTLQQVADKINASAANTILAATVRTDSTGNRLVLESINAGTAGSFYIDDRDITGKIHIPSAESDGQAAARIASSVGGSTANSVLTAVTDVSPGSQIYIAATAAANAPAATALSVVAAVDLKINELMLAPSAISTLCGSTSYNDVKSFDIYAKYGNAFTTRDLETGHGGTTEDLSSFQDGAWNIGKGVVNFDEGDVVSLDNIVRQINADQHATGVTAKVVEVTDGRFVIRVTASHGTPLNYTPESTMNIFPEGIATATRIRPTNDSDTNITVDGVHYNAGGALTINNPNSNIASITVSAPAPLDTFSITQDVAQLTTSIAILVDSINDAQQFIYQQRQEDAPLRSNNLLSQLSNMINSVTSSSTDTMSLSKMGITWNEYTPTSAEKKDGIVPAKYLAINPTTLNNILTSNFDAVKGFFAGSLAHAAGDATASIASLTSPLSIAQFDLKVSYSTIGPTFTVTADGGAGFIPMNPLHLGGTKLLITGVAGTIFEGLSINYNYTGAGGLGGLGTLGPAGYTLPDIKVYNGASLKLSRPLTSYLDVYGPLEKAITAEANKIKTSSKQIQRIIDQKNAALAKAQEKIDRIRFNTAIAESLKESFKNKN